MNEKRKIEPRKVFVRYVPDNTTVGELKTFFSSCGNVEFISLIPPKLPGAHSKHTRRSYSFGFVMFETQQEADRAVGELNGKIFVNKRGLSGTITVTHSRLTESRTIVESHSEGKRQTLESQNSDQNLLESRQELKNLQQESSELRKRYEANKEKLRQILHDPAMEQELKDLKMKEWQLKVKKEELEGKVRSIKAENYNLKLELKLKELHREQVKLKGVQ